MKTILFIEFSPESGSPNGLVAEMEIIKKHYSNLYNCVVIGPQQSTMQQACARLNYPYYGLQYTELPLIFDHPFRILPIFLKTLFTCMRIALVHEVALIHCNNYFWSIYGNPIGLLLRKPVVIHLKDVLLLEPRLARGLMKSNPNARYIAVSNYVRWLFINVYKVKKEKTIRIYDGINEKIFTPINPKTLDKKISQSNKIIVMMSRIAPERRVEVFIDCAALLCSKYPELTFRHYGHSVYDHSPHYFIELKRRVGALGIDKKFSFISYVNNPSRVAQILHSSYLSIVPASQFALPNTAIESMMCGTPVIANNIGGNPEIIPNQKMGTLTKTNSPLELAQSIELYLNNLVLYRQTSFAASTYTRKKFSLRLQVKKIIGLYNNLL